MVRMLRSPVKIPAVFPAGCVSDRAGRAEEVLTINSAALDAGDTVQAYIAWVQLLEEESAELLGLEGKQLSSFGGRSDGPKFVWKPAVGKPGSSALAVSRTTRAWQVASCWLLAVIPTSIICRRTPKAATSQPPGGRTKRELGLLTHALIKFTPRRFQHRVSINPN